MNGLKMKKENVKIIFDRRKLSKSTGRGDVEVYICLTKQCKKYMKLETVTEKQFNVKNAAGCYDDQLTRYRKLANAMVDLGEDLTLENLNRYLGIEVKEKKVVSEEEEIRSGSFTDWMYDEIGRTKTRPSTKEHEYTTWRMLNEWGKMTRFDELTPTNIYKFDRYLEEGNRGQTTRYNYHKHIIKYITIAVKLGIMESNPYHKCDIRKGSYKERVPLTEEEMIKIREFPFAGPLAVVRDMFVFAAYTGLAYCDLVLFDFEKMTDLVDGMYYIDGQRLKTGTKFYTPILPPAMEVLERNNFQVRCMTNEKANNYLKSIQSVCGIHKNLTFHLARHSFATLALSHGVSIENVARMLGHKNIRTTQIYAKILKKTVENQAQILASSIK